ncbi:hypothetical protein FPOA_08392 [Fusarium poae]|uniref:Uncharacterized protein n=1 Tax=Fusarium poae TaxID=36050 RepID=A0A1B8ANF0_FUSPO|nr:hypothetical protein FPOA_08392 [Fusarium poae]
MAGRDIPDRSTDYRDRPTDRYRGPPRDSRDTDHDFRRNERRETDKFAPRNHGQRTSVLSTPGGRSASRCDFQAGMDLIGEMSAAHGDLIKADSRLNKIKKEFNRSASRPIEFASVGSLQRKEIERGEEETDRLRRKLAQIYPRLQAELDSYLRISANPVTQPGTPTHIRNESDLEPRLSELRQSILKSGESRLQSEVTALQEVINEEKQRKRILADELEAQKRKNQSLEDRVSTLEVMFKTMKPEVEVQISSEINKQIIPRMTSLEDSLDKGLSNNAEATKQLQRLIDGHTEQLANLTSKRSADLVAGPGSTTVAQAATPNVTAETIRLRDNLEIQARNINFMQKEKLEPLSKIRDLERSMEQSSQDCQQAKRLVKIQSSVAEDYQKKQRSLEERFSTLESAAGEQAKKQRSLEEKFSTLENAAGDQAKEQRSLEEKFSTLENAAGDQAKEQRSLEEKFSTLENAAGEQAKEQRSLEEKFSTLENAAGEQAKEQRSLEEKFSTLENAAGDQAKKQRSLEEKFSTLENAAGDQAKKQRSLEEKFSTLENAAHDQGKKHSELNTTFTRLYSEQVEDNRARDTTIATLKSSTESFRKKTEFLEANVASLSASIKEKLQTEEGQASDLVQLQSSVNQLQKRTDDLGQKLNSDLAQQEKRTHDLGQKLNSDMAQLQSVINQLQKRTDDLGQKLNSDMAQLQSAVNQQQKRADDLGQKLASVSSTSTAQALDLSSLQASIEKHNIRSNLLEKNVTSLKSEITKRPPQDFEKLNAKIQEYPPAADLNCIVADFPSSKDIKMLIADMPRLRESVSKLKACKTPTPPPPNSTSSTTNETITQVVEDKIMQLDIATKEEMYKLFEDLFKKLSHDNEECAKQSFADVNKKLEESKEQTETAKKAGESLQKLFNEHTAEVKKKIDQLLEHVENEFKEVEFQIHAIDDWRKKLNTKKWYDNMAKHVTSYASSYFHQQLTSLSARVDNLEYRPDESEGPNKRRRTGSSNPPASNGAP